MEPKHTPLPWLIGHTGETPRIEAKNTGFANIVVATLEHAIPKRSVDLAEINANLIIAAVNNHQKLIDALKEAVVQIEYMQEKFGETVTANAVLSRNRLLLHSLETEPIKL